MKLSTWIVSASVAGATVLPLVYPEAMVSPGQLQEGHRELDADCWACHTALRGATSTQCVQCHEVGDIGLLTSSGEPIPADQASVPFHQELLEDDCVACHSDHRYRTARRFSHELLQPSTRNGCATCHEAPVDSLHGETTGDCQACHAVERWSPATLDHDRHFRFDRDHETECATCHEGNDYQRYTCYGCHEHSPRNVREEHLEEGIEDFDECTECHRSGDEDEAERRMRNLPGREQSRRDDHDDDDHDDHDDHDHDHDHD